uniref:ATP-dependent DNA helicase n=1 Tax=Amphimedon queenslandica TaxID=400682 RepID=A0A1X7VG67_AMPQE
MEAVADIADMHINVPNLTLEQRETMLNVDQKRIFDKIKSHLISQKEREDLLENESSRLLRLDNIKLLRMFISGVGGTGKSFLIEAIKCLVDDIWHPKSGEIMCAIVAPTGIAAFNVGGLTIHRLFQLPIEHEGKTAGYWALNKEAQKRIKMTLKNLKIIIVDEVFMVSNLNLAYLHMRLEDIFGTDEWFGSKNILFVGDLLQLPPVNGRPIF